MTVRETVDIERLLIWTYQVKAADSVVSRQMAWLGPDRPVTNAQGLMRMAALGCRVDNAGLCVPRENDLDPDAEAVHDAVMALGNEAGALVLYHAKTGSRPDWMPGAVSRMRPVMRGNGKPSMVYWDHPKCRKPAYCRVTADPPQGRIDAARHVYAMWWDALRGLAETLEQLRAYVVAGPAAAFMPWLQEGLTGGEKLDYRSAR